MSKRTFWCLRVLHLLLAREPLNNKKIKQKSANLKSFVFSKYSNHNIGDIRTNSADNGSVEFISTRIK